MNTNKYQVWEGEMEAAGLEENGVSFFSALFSALLGIILLIALVGRTIFAILFRVKVSGKRKISSEVKPSELKMSVS